MESFLSGVDLKFEDNGFTSNVDDSPRRSSPVSLSPADSFSEQVIQPAKYGVLVANRVFVGGLCDTTTDVDLIDAFSRYGNVKGTTIILDRAGSPKGYGFVTFEAEEEAKGLYSKLANKELEPIVIRGRRINVAPAIKKLLHPDLKAAACGGLPKVTGSGATTFLYTTTAPTSSSGGGGGGLFSPPAVQMTPKYFISSRNPPPGFNIDQASSGRLPLGETSSCGNYCYLTAIPVSVPVPQGSGTSSQVTSSAGNQQQLQLSTGGGNSGSDDAPQFVMGWLV